jgi:S-DNA-T family DNA segregation ATPase FtsK/SpoIIIE
MAQTKRKPGRPKGSINQRTKYKKQNEEKIDRSKVGNRVIDEIWSIILFGIGIFLIISLQTKASGEFGAVIANILKGSFGMVAFILPYYLIIYGILLFAKKTVHMNVRSIAFIITIFLMLTFINSARFIDLEQIALNVNAVKDMFAEGILLNNGGLVGMYIGALIVKIFGETGLYIISIVTILVSLMLVINTPLSHFFDALKEKRRAKKEEKANLYARVDDEIDEELKNNVRAGFKPNQGQVKGINESVSTVKKTLELAETAGNITAGQLKILDYMKDDDLFSTEEIKPSNRISNSKAAATNLSIEEVKNIGGSETYKSFKLPSIELLKKLKVSDSILNTSELKAKAEKLERTLQNFNVNAKVVQVTQGPAITRYEIQPSVGVKVNSIVRLADDIALNLEAKSIRIEAPIPGKAAVGIEVENERINLVSIRELIESKEFRASKSKISFVVGKDIGGNPIISDLKAMPHLLIAGSTGSGKSVAINSIILSMLFKAKPDEVKFVLIDPKVVELGGYNGIPHLLIPVVTEPGKAAAALNWAVAEMTNRYKKFAEESVRDLESFNETVRFNGEAEKVLPQIVIVIDELADLMMAAPSQVEESICRLAQMARAAGMHLIVATQRPSVDIITGVIKANIPSRIAFAVSSQFDSRTILDMGGAEKLVGKGDMLFNPLGLAKPIRVQGTYVSDGEVKGVISFLKNQGVAAEYSTDVMNTIDKVNLSANEDSSNDDDLLTEAIEAVIKAEQASVSMIQRRFRVGYNRAARMIDMMEDRGIIGPADGSRPRQVLMSEDEYLEMHKYIKDLET